jgi:hypothetical protein
MDGMGGDDLRGRFAGWVRFDKESWGLRCCCARAGDRAIYDTLHLL